MNENEKENIPEMKDSGSGRRHLPRSLSGKSLTVQLQNHLDDVIERYLSGVMLAGLLEVRHLSGLDFYAGIQFFGNQKFHTDVHL